MEELLAAAGGLFALAFLLGAGLEALGRRFPPRREGKAAELRVLLPGANCGACGLAGCDALAAALAKGEADPRTCTVGGEELVTRLAAVLGVSLPAGETAPLYPVVFCRGGEDVSSPRGTYRGIADCRAAAVTGDGGTACVYGCLRLGTCGAVCPTGALRTGDDGLPVLDQARCNGCGLCVRVCPRGLIRLLPANQPVQVLCSSPAPAHRVLAVCRAGCTGCRRCERACPVAAIRFDGFLAVVAGDRCRSCSACQETCPTGVIVDRGTH